MHISFLSLIYYTPAPERLSHWAISLCETEVKLDQIILSYILDFSSTLVNFYGN